ncbi:hypothetical protein A5761_00850 [Mycolicibacterium setense]|uniref:hypothetical protein n=1 Tax=Mycolicibacterium setense TaxID=431269 RepID=UPI0003AA32C0|nr:hypothetical protein [Mycolicibacterium setense]OBB19723.1 hypothetical protein A5761_00850 [Mycolicibacterium setense]
MRLTAVAAALFVALSVGVSGCTGAPDREKEALDIRDRIAAMPGVEDVDLIYDNGILEGTRFELKVDMPRASDQQVGAVAAQLDELRGDDFAKFNQRMEILVADRTSVSGSAGLPDDIDQVTGLLRRLGSDAPAGEIRWSGAAAPAASKLRILEAEKPGAAVDAVLRIFADRSPSDIEVSAADRVADPHWMIVNRLSLADKQRIDGQLAAAAPADPGWIGVRDGRIERLTFSVPTPATAYEDVVRTIRVIEAGPAHPVSLLWHWADDPSRFNEPRWAGSAMIGKCDYVNGDRTKSEPLVPDALALQQRIRDEFDTCLK